MSNKFKVNLFMGIGLFFIVIFISFFRVKDSMAQNEMLQDPELNSAVEWASQNDLTRYEDVEAFRPAATITREQAAKFFVSFAQSALGKEVSENSECSFEDTDSADPTLKEYITQSCKMGIIKGHEGKFMPKQPLTKPQALTILVRALDGSKDENVTPWYKNYYQWASNRGITNQSLEYIAHNASRYETLLMLYRSRDGVPEVSQQQEEGYQMQEYTPVSASSRTLNLSFDSAMNKDSVEKNLRVYPDMDKDIDWKDDKNLSLKINQELTGDQKVVVNVSEDAETKTGKKLEKTKVEYFKVGAQPQISFVSPQGKINDLTKNITVRFNKPMVPLTNLDNQRKCPVEITPELPGKCVWITTSTFQFRPEGGFPIGAEYQVNIPSGIEAVAGSATQNAKNFKVSTPDFKVVSQLQEIGKDKQLVISFNADVRLEEFKNNFSMQEFSNSELDIQYLQQENDVGEMENKKDTVTIFPKNGDWGYDNKYSYSVSDNLTSRRGNVGLKNKVSTSFKTNKLLTSYNPFVYKDDSLEHKRQTQNMYKADTQNIIKPQDPKVLLNFYREMPLNDGLFSANADFDLKYEEVYDCSDGTCEWKKDKKSVIMEVNGNVDNLNLKIKASSISSSEDVSLSFNTKSQNQVKGFNFVDYDKFCMDFKYPIRSQSKYFEFDKYGKVNYINRIDNRNYYEGPCEAKDGFATYQVSTKINPETDYNLTVKKGLLDKDNYQLKKDYIYSFRTNAAKNSDKHLSLFDSRRFIVTPEYVSPLGVAIKTVNLDEVKAKVCQGRFDITDEDFMKDTECEEGVLEVNDLGFRTNFSVLNLEEIMGKKFDKKFVKLTVSKLDEDKTEHEKENNSKEKTSFIRTDKNVVFKSAKDNNLLWLTNFHNGTALEGQVKSIKNYTSDREYDKYGNYQGKKVAYQGELDFSEKGKGVYEVDGNPADYLLITLESGEQIMASPGAVHGDDRKVTYIKTDRPIYKPGDTVHIKGVSRFLTPTKFRTNSSQEKLSVRGPEYEDVFEKNVNLSSNGTFEIEWKIPEDASLGNYRVSMPGGSYQIAVEEYEKPDFKINLDKNKDFFLYGENAEVDVSADYYIGSPLQNGEGKYSIEAQEWHFNGGKTDGYIWGDNSGSYGFHHFSQPSDERTITRNQEYVLDKNGEKTLDIELENPSGENAKNYRYNLSTTVQDPSTKKSVSKSTSFKVSKTDVFVGMKFDKYYYEYGDNVSMDFVTVDENGNKLANKDIELKISKLTYEQDPETFEYEQKEEVLDEKELKTDGSGKAGFDYNLSEYGKIKFQISLKSGKYTTSKSVYVSGRDLVRPREERHDLNILQNKGKYDVGETGEFVLQSNWTGVKALVTVEKFGEVLKWDVVNINSASQKYSLDIKKEYIPNFYLNAFIIKDVQKSQESLEKLKEVRSQMESLEQELLNATGVQSIPGPPIIYDITHREGIIPPVPDSNVDLDEELLEQLAEYRKKEQDLMQQIMPDWQQGQKKIELNLDHVNLSANADTDKAKYLPGDSSTITLNVTDDKGNPVNGEAMIAVVDKAVLALKSDDRNVLDYFYNNVGEGVRDFLSLNNLIKRFEFSSSEQIQKSQPEAGFGRGGGDVVYSNAGGAVKQEMAEEADMARDSGKEDSEEDENIRTDFEDTAFYKGIVEVDNGEATIQVSKLPDNLTTWVAQGFIVTSDTKVGEFETEFRTRKKLSLIPSVPRFLMAGDRTQMTAVAVNNTSSPLDVTAKVEYDQDQPITVKNPEKTVTVQPDSQKNVSWEVEVSSLGNETDRDNAEAEFTISLSAGNLKDGVKFTRDVNPYSTPEYVFTNGNTETSKSYAEKIVLPDYVEKNLGKIDIQIGSNILTNLTDSIDNIASMPGNNLRRTLDALGKGAVLKKLYSSIKEESKFYEIQVRDYNSNVHKLDNIVKDRKQDFAKFQQEDGGMSYYQDCVPRENYECSSFELTLNFLKTVNKMEEAGYDVDDNVVSQALSYTKQSLKSTIQEYEKDGGTYRKIKPFYILKDFDEDFVSQYVPSHRFDQDYGFSNIEKLKIMGVLQELDSNQSLIDDFMKDLKNSTLIEARGTLLPADYKSFEHRGNYSNNVQSTALAMKMFTNEGESEKLLIENFARWLMAQKEEDGDFGGGSTESVISAIIDYIKFTGEFENIDFTAKGYLNGNKVINGEFTMDNKFEVEKESFPLSRYLKFGKDEENILGFEKSGSGKLYYDVGMKYFLPIEEIAPRDEGLVISRKYYDYEEYNEAFEKECYWPVYRYYGGGYGGGYNNCRMVKKKEIEPVNSVKRGDYVVGQVKVVVPHTRNNVVVNNYIPAGAKLLNTNLDITSSNVKDVSGQSGNGWGGFNHIEYQKDRLFMFARRLTKGTYKFTYVMNTRNAGKYHNRPAVVKLLEKPEIWGRTAGSYFHINE